MQGFFLHKAIQQNKHDEIVYNRFQANILFLNSPKNIKKPLIFW